MVEVEVEEVDTIEPDLMEEDPNVVQEGMQRLTSLPLSLTPLIQTSKGKKIPNKMTPRIPMFFKKVCKGGPPYVPLSLTPLLQTPKGKKIPNKMTPCWRGVLPLA